MKQKVKDEKAVWIENEYYRKLYHCSNCHQPSPDRPKICPKCGKKIKRHSLTVY